MYYPPFMRQVWPPPFTTQKKKHRKWVLGWVAAVFRHGIRQDPLTPSHMSTTNRRMSGHLQELMAVLWPENPYSSFGKGCSCTMYVC